MRLFTALWPSAEAVAALRAVLPAEQPPQWRWTDPASWHVTLAFHGEADPGRTARALAAAARGLPPPRLRIGGSGAFPGVGWAGVEAEPVAALVDLVTAAGGDPARFVAHMTLARRRGRAGPETGGLPDLTAGPWWRPADVRLVASHGARYEVVHRVTLA